jgi:hypothetical protein
MGRPTRVQVQRVVDMFANSRFCTLHNLVVVGLSESSGVNPMRLVS